MEEQIIKTIQAPRVSIKRGLKTKAIGWEIASSSSGDGEEIQKIMEMLKEKTNELMIIKKEEVEKKK